LRLFPQKCLFILILVFASITGFSQKETADWLLDYGNRIHFNNGAVTRPGNGPADILNGTSSLCDANGNLLMATDGKKVLDRNFQEMPGQDQLTNFSGSSIPMFIQMPGQPSLFYLFYNHSSTWNPEGTWDLYYAIIDMNLNGGLGAVTSIENVLVRELSRGYTLVRKPGGEDFWIITHQHRTKNFECHLVNNTGISNQPVTNSVGSNSVSTEYFFMDLRASHNGKMIAGIAYTNYSVNFARTVRFVEIFNFDAITGKLSEKIKSLRQDRYFINRASVEFSPDNRLLYMEESFEARDLQPYGLASSTIWQYNLCYSDSVTFTMNAPFISQWVSTGFMVTYGRLQIGADKKLYFPHSGTLGLWGFEHPNEIGTSAMVKQDVVPLPRPGGLVTPSFYHHYLDKAVGSNIVYTGNCFPEPIHFSVTNDTISRISWNFGDPASANNQSSVLKPDHSFSTPGFYTVTASLYNVKNELIEIIERQLEIKDPGKRLLFNYPKDTVVCEGATLNLKLNAINAIFIWSVRYIDQPDNVYRTSLSDSLIIRESGTYYVQMLQNDCDGCSRIDSIKFIVLPSPYVSLGDDRNLCSGDSLVLSAYEQANTVYTWSTGASSSSITVHQGGSYWVEAEFNQNGCSQRDTIVVNNIPGLLLELPSDTTLCNNQTLLLKVENNNAYNMWQDNTFGNSFLIDQPGKYWVTVFSNDGCIKSDTIQVQVINAATVDLGADTSICAGDSLLVTSNIAASNYLWSTGI
jgi:hypothetical protein